MMKPAVPGVCLNAQGAAPWRKLVAKFSTGKPFAAKELKQLRNFQCESNDKLKVHDHLV